MARLLILGGTFEAASLARRVAALPDFEVITSLAGRTDAPPALPGRVRIGGFGGTDGLAAFLRAEAIDALIDATHPFAAQISAHAVAACRAAGVSRLALIRPSWQKVAGDRWVMAEDAGDAAARLPALGRRAFLTVGLGELAAFAACPDIHYLVRLIEPHPVPLPDSDLVLGRGPFRVEDETVLMRDHAIDVLVTKESGGDATYAKIEAARILSLPVLMIRRPPPPDGAVVEDETAAVDWVKGVAGIG